MQLAEGGACHASTANSLPVSCWTSCLASFQCLESFLPLLLGAYNPVLPCPQSHTTCLKGHYIVGRHGWWSYLPCIPCFADQRVLCYLPGHRVVVDPGDWLFEMEMCAFSFWKLVADPQWWPPEAIIPRVGVENCGASSGIIFAFQWPVIIAEIPIVTMNRELAVLSISRSLCLKRLNSMGN